MARGFPLEPVRAVLHRKTEDAAAAVRGHAQRLEAARAKFGELERYLAEYRAQQQQVMAQGAASHRLREFQAFLSRIQTALEAQAAEVVRHESLWESARAFWAEASRREQAFDVLAERHADRELRNEIRAEQKLQDEHATRKAARPGEKTN